METYDVATVLGIHKVAKNSFEVMHHVERGLPFFSLDHIVAQIAPDDANFKYRLIPKATLVAAGEDPPLFAAH